MNDLPQTNFADDEFLTRSEVCDLLKVSKRTLWEWHRDGEGPPRVTINGCVRYPRQILDRFLADSIEAA